MSTQGSAAAGVRAVLVPDLDGELLVPLAVVEEVLLALGMWEDEDRDAASGQGSGLHLPPSLADHVTLVARCSGSPRAEAHRPAPLQPSIQGTSSTGTMHEMTSPHDVGELAALRAAAERRRAVRRQIADAVVQHGPKSPETIQLRQELQAINTEWAGLIRQAAVDGHALADIARAAGVAVPSLYYRLRQPQPGDSVHRPQSPGGGLSGVGKPAPAVAVDLDHRAVDDQGLPIQDPDRAAR